MYLKNIAKYCSQIALVLMNILMLENVESKAINDMKTNTSSKFEYDFLITETQTIEDIRKNLHKRSEDLNLNISQLVNKYGYPLEEHEVVTKDGYIITLHRIPREGKAVLFVHGIGLSSEGWVINGPENGLPYILAAQGYDVWMTNARGNVHSRKHKFLNLNSPEFWKFSWNEIGRYDLPASIDYILDLKGDKQLNYVGFSQGTTAFWVLCSEMPEYNDRISIMISLSTVAWMSNLYSPLLRVLLETNAFSLLTFNKYELLPLRETYSNLCNENSVPKFLCANLFYLSFGFDLGQLNVTNLPLLLKHSPAGCSYFQMKHYEQLIYSGKFRKFDYGRKTNLKIYGSVEPPNYNVKRITTPVAIFHSDYDWFSDRRDVMTIKNKLRNVIEFNVVEKPFNHVDYLIGKDVGKLVYSKILNLFNKYKNESYLNVSVSRFITK